MPDLSKSTPPPVPPVTPEEQDAQSFLRRVRELLWFIEWFLNRAYDRLPDPPDAEAMGTGDIPESLAFSLRGSIECAQADHVDPLYNLLRDAVEETPERLIRGWQARQKGKGR
ncbi:MAG TPA: hypothetical protein VNL71_12575 [Chloroflexota bacterium]|nr:hypothetical protein [Chloroflexota bacterium]